MTIDEHMAMKDLLMNVRDELADLARRDENVWGYVEDVEICLTILRSLAARGALTSVGSADAVS